LLFRAKELIAQAMAFFDEATSCFQQSGFAERLYFPPNF